MKLRLLAILLLSPLLSFAQLTGGAGNCNGVGSPNVGTTNTDLTYLGEDSCMKYRNSVTSEWWTRVGTSNVWVLEDQDATQVPMNPSVTIGGVARSTVQAAVEGLLADNNGVFSPANQNGTLAVTNATLGGNTTLNMGAATEFIFESTNAGPSTIISNFNSTAIGSNIIKGIELQRLGAPRIGMYYTLDSQPGFIGSIANQNVGIRTNNQLQTQFNTDGSVIIANYANIFTGQLGGLDVRTNVGGVHIAVGSPEAGNEDGGVIGFRRPDGALAAKVGYTDDDNLFVVDNSATGSGSFDFRYSGNLIGSQLGKFSISQLDGEVFSIDRRGSITQSLYGSGTQTAAALSKTESGFLAGFATDGTVLEISDPSLETPVTINGTSRTTLQEVANAIADTETNGSWTPTFTVGTGTVTGSDLHWMRVGDDLFVSGTISFSSTANALHDIVFTPPVLAGKTFSTAHGAGNAGVTNSTIAPGAVALFSATEASVTIEIPNNQDAIIFVSAMFKYN